jgi:hypothetical protein
VSAEAAGWVWKHSPYTGAKLIVHLAIGDIVNDAHGHEFWMTLDNLQKKTRVARSSLIDALKTMTENGHLELLESGKATRTSSRYRFRFDGPKREQPSTGAMTALDDRRDDRASTGAISELELARSSRSNSRENPRTQGDPLCVQCQGQGFYFGGAGFDVRCDCVNLRVVQ